MSGSSDDAMEQELEQEQEYESEMESKEKRRQSLLEKKEMTNLKRTEGSGFADDMSDDEDTLG